MICNILNAEEIEEQLCKKERNIDLRWDGATLRNRCRKHPWMWFLSQAGTEAIERFQKYLTCHWLCSSFLER